MTPQIMLVIHTAYTFYKIVLVNESEITNALHILSGPPVRVDLFEYELDARGNLLATKLIRRIV